jgi:RNA:NAD 2'-phosphotransferase (TPT1/KptA family)
LVRTHQGHIIPLAVEELYTGIILPEEVADFIPCIHGTYEVNAESILQKGLQPGVQLKHGRQAVHILDLGLKHRQPIELSRVREDANAIIDFDLFQWLLDGRKAFLSSNGVLDNFEPIDQV